MSKPQPATTRTRARSKRTLRIFLNYRREDSSGHAGRLYDDLAERFGDDRIFMDIDKIEPGLDFGESIERALESCDVVLAVIGRQWVTITDGKGLRRLDNPDDYVRMELEAALDRGMRLIPVRVQGTDMPSSSDIPASLGALCRRQAVELSDNRWRYDVDVLASALERLAAENAGKAREERERIAQERAQLEQTQLEEAEQQRLTADEEAQRAAQEETELQRRAAEEEDQRAEAEEAERQRVAAELAARHAAQEEAERQRLAAEEEARRAEAEEAERQRLATEAEARRTAQEAAERQRIAAETEQAERESRERERIVARAEAERMAQEKAARDQRERERIAVEEAERKQAAEDEAERRRVAAEAERKRKAQESAERSRREQELTAARQAESERTAQEEKERRRAVVPVAAGPTRQLDRKPTKARTPMYRRPIALAAGAVLAVTIGAVVAIPIFGGGDESAAALIPGIASPPGTSRPSIEGIARAGTTLTANRGRWRNSPAKFGFQWLRCTNGGTCANVRGATSGKYELSGKDVGKRMRVVVTATNAEGAGTSRSNATPLIAAAPKHPSNVAPPSVSGTAQAGERLEVRKGSWRGTTPLSSKLVWLRCNASGSGCTKINGVSGRTYALRPQDVGHTIRVEEVVSNEAARSVARSRATSLVSAKPAPASPEPPAPIPSPQPQPQPDPEPPRPP